MFWRSTTRNVSVHLATLFSKCISSYAGDIQHDLHTLYTYLRTACLPFVAECYGSCYLCKRFMQEADCSVAAHPQMSRLAHRAPQGIVPNVQNWNALLDAIGRAGQIDAMLEKYREMRTSGQRPDRFTMHTMLSNAAAAGRCDIAQATWMEMRDVQMEPEARNYNAMINCYATAEEPEKAEEVLAEMCESASVKPDVLTFSSLMKAYIVVGRLDEAESVISRMRAAGVEPDLQTWKSIIHAADAARDVKRADQLYSELLLSGTFKPYKSWRNSNIKDVSGKRQPKGTVMDLHKTNPGTGRAAIRHELQLQRSSASERTTPLYIITGQGAGLLRAAVSDALNAQGIHHLLPAAHPGRIIIPPTRIHSR
eukprot:TRINITY_DN583_c0_g1_i2.p1 TRINITY_DN583_c0_g1~~TRINITY_DN583_c0_g1_i2.p1  ORF type:complete len:367 (+),score=47.39 TRINITY_DN583_c0_g1_i2:1276-2376(+)